MGAATRAGTLRPAIVRPGPSRLDEYVEAGCDGFVVDLGHASPDLEERVRRFAQEVVPLLVKR